MPGFDGSGPFGKGSFSGRGMGYCMVKINNVKIDNRIIDKEVIKMPRGDGTGPMGLGPMTGRSAGYCAGYSMPGYANPVPGRGFGFGRGFGRGRGWGRGFGWRAAGYPYAYGYPYGSAYVDNVVTRKQEAEMLKAEARAMQKDIDAINQRIKDLESADLSQNNG